MKKLISAVLALMLALCAFPALADLAADLEAGSAMSFDELLEKASEEKGNFVVLGNTSRIVKAAAAFSSLYDIDIEAANMKDQAIYDKLDTSVIDMVLIQDGAHLLEHIADGTLVNFVPANAAEAVSQSERDPALIQQYINKVFIYNNLGDQVPAIKNVWELTDPALKGKVLFKNPTRETVNMNFLVMLTNDDWSEKLAEAYKSWKGEDIQLGEYKNAGYKWIAEFLGNTSFISSDTTIAEELSQETAEGKIGLFVLNKLRSKTVDTANLTVAQVDGVENDYSIEPFAGFMYPMYAMIPANAQRPYTAMLFISYLMTEEGFVFWGDSIGAYSPNHDIPASDNENNLDLETWKKSLVIEDPEYILAHTDVEDFIRGYCK